MKHPFFNKEKKKIPKYQIVRELDKNIPENVKKLIYVFHVLEKTIIPDFIEDLDLLTLDNIILPNNLKSLTLTLWWGEVNLPKDFLPLSLEKLSIHSQKINNVYLPKNLKYLSVNSDDIDKIDLTNLPMLEKLKLKVGFPRKKLNLDFLPSSLKSLKLLEGSNINRKEELYNCLNLPSSLTSLTYEGGFIDLNSIPSTIKKFKFDGRNKNFSNFILLNDFDKLVLKNILIGKEIVVGNIKDLRLINIIRRCAFMTLPKSVEYFYCDFLRNLYFDGKYPNLKIAEMYVAFMHSKPKNMKIKNGIYEKIKNPKKSL